MKKFFAVAVVLGLAACAPKEAAPAVDTTATAPVAADTMAADTTKPADTTHAAAPAAPAAH